MNTEAYLQLAVNNPSLLSTSGSRLYGTNTPTSDYDMRGFTIPPFEYLLNIRNFECAELEGDHKVFSLKRFLDLTLSGDPQTTEILYCNESQLIKCNEIGQQVLNLRDSIISMNIYARILGYSTSEWRKCRGEKMVIDKMPKTSQQILDEIRSVRPDIEKAEMDAVVEILTKRLDKTIVSSISGVGEKRKKQFEEFGYCTSSASHCIRLVTQLHDLIRFGRMSFPLQNCELLRDIKLGKYSLSFVDKLYKEKAAEVEADKSKSVLPEKPNREKVWNEYTKIISNFLMNDTRFKEFVFVK